MADTTYTDLLTQYKAAMLAIATGGQSYTINGRQFTRADLAAIQNAIDWLEPRAAVEADADDAGPFFVARTGEM